MSNLGRPDSATALARSPLFSNLGRLDLARLAGELEERHFKPGEVIVRQGDLPDGFYVIKQGRAAVRASGARTGGDGDGTGEQLTTLGPGEVFGEMALLTDSPRTATVVAETDLTVWRLSRPRFEALLDHERGIARSIERSLSLRLAAMNLETGALRAFSHRLTSAALGRLSRPAAALLAGVATRSRWTAETLRRACARTGDEGALAELIEQSALLRADGSDLVVDPTFLALAGPEVREPNPAWLRAASEVMAEAGDVVAATDLALAAGAVEDAERLLGAHETRLLQTASSGDLDRWMATVSERAPTLGARLGALRTRLSERLATPAEAAPGSRERATPLLGRVARQFTTVRALATIAAIAIFELGWILPLPEGLGRSGLITLAAIIATVPLLVANVLPDYVVMLFLTLALVRTRPRVARGHPRRLRRSRLAHDLHAARGGRGGGPLGAHVPAGAPVAPATAAAIRPPERGALPDRGRDDRGALERLHADRARSADRARDHRRHGIRAPKPGRGGGRVDDVLHLPRDGRAVPDRDLHGSHRPRPAPGGRQGPDHLVALVLHRAAAVRRHRCRDVPGAALPLQAAQDGAGQPGSGAAPAGAPRPSHAKRDLERGGAASPHRRVRHPARTTESPRRGCP